ncbi:hypothetical protein SDC9_199835 [bioreactor metagenome]|uniref:Uncharacterized protein n=1 Tax=bioreactor metagenome TaxID=1076179 RepID=A0A645ILL3_9ZZZZ
MNFNAGPPAGNIGDPAGQKTMIFQVERMGDAVSQDRLDMGIKQEDLPAVLSSRVTFQDGINILQQGSY